MTEWYNFNPLQREAEDCLLISVKEDKMHFNPLQREAEDLVNAEYGSGLRYFNPLQREAEDVMRSAFLPYSYIFQSTSARS